MTKEKILIIDDEASICSALKGILEDEGFLVKTAESGEQGLELLKSQNVDLVLLDIWLPKMSGIDVLKKIKAMEESPQVVMISGHGTIETAVTATKLGAHDFLEKPLSLEKVVLTVRNALRQKKLEEENILLRERQRGRYHLIGESPAMRRRPGCPLLTWHAHTASTAQGRTIRAIPVPFFAASARRVSAVRT